jgi:hypothetical protein
MASGGARYRPATCFAGFSESAKIEHENTRFADLRRQLKTFLDVSHNSKQTGSLSYLP